MNRPTARRKKERKSPRVARLAAAVSLPRLSWQAALAGFGAVALLTVLVALFLPFGKGPRLIRTTAPVPPVQSPEFLRLVSDVLNVPIDSGPPPAVLNNGDAFLKSVLSDIDGAKSSIDFMAYIWEDGKFSDTLLSHLERKARAGVQVRLALDGYGSLRAPIEKLKRFREAGGKTTTFHTLMPLPWAMARDHKRNHRRAIIIDGRIAYTGGIAVADTWLGDAKNSSQWRDMMFRVEGSLASHLQAAFAEVWELGTGEVLAGTRRASSGPDDE